MAWLLAGRDAPQLGINQYVAGYLIKYKTSSEAIRYEIIVLNAPEATLIRQIIDSKFVAKSL